MSIFRLQQFAINQSRSGMKICSDSLLFGALIPLDGAKRVLDIGAGTGILSLMQAQKANDAGCSELNITAVELTQAAAEEARENFANSPWSEQLELVAQDIQSFADHHSAQQAGYDLIICNPPFFAEQSKTASDKPLRHTARHTDSLSFQDLIHSIDLLLTMKGKAFLLLPLTAAADFCQQAQQKKLYLSQQIDIAESSTHRAKVALLQFQRNEVASTTFATQRLNKFQQPNIHTGEAQKLLQPFLLRYC